MNHVFEIPNDLPAEWPSSWSGSTRIDCGSHGGFFTTLYTRSHPSADNIANFRDILSCWDEVWPKICTTVSVTFKCPHTIHCPGAVMDMWLPDTPISHGAKWNILLHFHKIPVRWGAHSSDGT